MMSVHYLNTTLVLAHSTQYIVYMWDSQSGQLIWEDLVYTQNAPLLAISHSGNMVVVWADWACQVRNTSIGTIISRWGTTSKLHSVAFSLDEKRIIGIKQTISVFKTSRTIEQWDIESGTMIVPPETTDAASSLESGMFGTFFV